MPSRTFSSTAMFRFESLQSFEITRSLLLAKHFSFASLLAVQVPRALGVIELVGKRGTLVGIFFLFRGSFRPLLGAFQTLFLKGFEQSPLAFFPFTLLTCFRCRRTRFDAADRPGLRVGRRTIAEVHLSSLVRPTINVTRLACAGKHTEHYDHGGYVLEGPALLATGGRG